MAEIDCSIRKGERLATDFGEVAPRRVSGEC